MKIVLVSDYYAPHVGGGVERVVEELARNLVNFGHEVRVVTFNPDGYPARENDNGIQIIRIPAVNLQPVVGVPAALNASLGLKRFFEGADVIHVHNIFFLLSVLTVMARPRAPVITTMHLGSLSNMTGVTGSVGRFYERTVGFYILQRSAAVSAVSASVAQHASHLGTSTPVHIIPNSVDVEKFRPPETSNKHQEDGQSVLFLGRFSRNKGPQFLVEAIPRILAQVPDASFTFLGDGPLRGPIARRLRELKVQKEVRIQGTVPDVVPMLQEAQLVVRPSLTEGMPLAVMEAMACGRTVVASRVAGISDIIRDGENGVLVEPGDIDSLAEGVVKVLTDRARAKDIGRRAREWSLRQMTWDSIAQQYLSVYEAVAS